MYQFGYIRTHSLSAHYLKLWAWLWYVNDTEREKR